MTTPTVIAALFGLAYLALCAYPIHQTGLGCSTHSPAKLGVSPRIGDPSGAARASLALTTTVCIFDDMTDEFQTSGADDDLTGLAWRLGHATSRDGRWIRTVFVGYLHGRDQVLDDAADEAALDALQLASSLRGTLEILTETLVKEARDLGASWAKIGDAAGVSKQTAYSRWGGTSPLESRSDGSLVLHDLERDADHRFTPIIPETKPTGSKGGVKPTPEQRAVIGGRFAGTPVAESEKEMDLVAVAVTTMAYGLAAQSGADWATDWQHYLDLALRVAAPNSAVNHTTDPKH